MYLYSLVWIYAPEQIRQHNPAHRTTPFHNALSLSLSKMSTKSALSALHTHEHTHTKHTPNPRENEESSTPSTRKLSVYTKHTHLHKSTRKTVQSCQAVEHHILLQCYVANIKIQSPFFPPGEENIYCVHSCCCRRRRFCSADFQDHIKSTAVPKSPVISPHISVYVWFLFVSLRCIRVQRRYRA